MTITGFNQELIEREQVYTTIEKTIAKHTDWTYLFTVKEPVAHTTIEYAYFLKIKIGG